MTDQQWVEVHCSDCSKQIWVDADSYKRNQAANITPPYLCADCVWKPRAV
jgi:DNA-directed RNA polymerase subunit RPC12/RpoP